jgi:hypothetical protein
MRERRLFRAQLEQLLAAVRASEPHAREQDVVAVVAQRPPWTTRRLEPAVLVLDRAAARLWHGGLDGSAVLHAEIGPGWSVRFDRTVVRLERQDELLELWLPKGGDPRLGDRTAHHRLVAALERALGQTPEVAPRVAIDRVGVAPPSEVVLGGLALLGLLAVAAAFAVPTLRLGWTLDPLVSLLAVAGLLVGGGWLWLPYQRGRDGWVGLYPDRLVHLQDRLVVLPWSAVRGFDDRPSSWVALDCDPPLTIPTVDEPSRTAVLAALDAAGLRRSS